MREIVLDTETTGLNPRTGDRLVEIGCVELDNHVRTGNTYHQYVNPERDMPDEAFAVHGLSEAFLAKHPIFSDVVTPMVGSNGPTLVPLDLWPMHFPETKVLHA